MVDLARDISDIADRMQRQALACALLANPALQPSDTRTLLSETAAWVTTGRWPSGVAVEEAPPVAVSAGRSTVKVRPIKRGSRAEKALAYFQGLLDKGSALRGNPEMARDLGIPAPDSDAAGRRVSKLLGRAAAHQGWTIERSGCSASGTFRRRIVAPDGRSTAMVEDPVLSAAPAVTQSQAPATEPDANPSAAGAPTKTTPAAVGPAGELGTAPPAARSPEADHELTAQADTGHAPDAAGAPLGVAPALSGRQPACRGAIDPAGERRVDKLAAALLESVINGQPVPSNADLGARVGVRPASVADLFVVLEKARWGRMRYLGGGRAMRRRYELADGRTTPWCAPIGTKKAAEPEPAAQSAPTTIATPPRPNINTGLIERRPAIAAKARSAADRDVSPEMRAQIDQRVAAGAVTRIERPGYGVASDSAQIHSTAGARRSASY